MVRQIPNILTFGRLVLSGVFLVLVALGQGGPEPDKLLLDIAFVTFVVAGLTDMIDGEIARRLGVASKFGRMLDPLVDKVLICGGFILLAIIGIPQLFDWSDSVMAAVRWLVAGIITAREVFVTLLRHIAEARGVNFAATWSGKVKMFAQSFTIGTVLIKTAHFGQAEWANWFTLVVLAVTVVITVVSARSALRRSRT